MSAVRGNKIKLVFRQRTWRVMIGLTLLLLAIGWAVSLWRFPPLAGEGDILPLHYNIYFGVDAVGPWWRILVIPGFATLAFLLNLLMMTAKQKDDSVRVMLLGITSLLVALLCDVALVFILLANL
mgnify:FL=1